MELLVTLYPATELTIIPQPLKDDFLSGFMYALVQSGNGSGVVINNKEPTKTSLPDLLPKTDDESEYISSSTKKMKFHYYDIYDFLGGVWTLLEITNHVREKDVIRELEKRLENSYKSMVKKLDIPLNRLNFKDDTLALDGKQTLYFKKSIYYKVVGDASEIAGFLFALKVNKPCLYKLGNAYKITQMSNHIFNIRDASVNEQFIVIDGAVLFVDPIKFKNGYDSYTNGPEFDVIETKYDFENEESGISKFLKIEPFEEKKTVFICHIPENYISQVYVENKYVLMGIKVAMHSYNELSDFHEDNLMTCGYNYFTDTQKDEPWIQKVSKQDWDKFKQGDDKIKSVSSVVDYVLKTNDAEDIIYGIYLTIKSMSRLSYYIPNLEYLKFICASMGLMMDGEPLNIEEAIPIRFISEYAQPEYRNWNKGSFYVKIFRKNSASNPKPRFLNLDFVVEIEENEYVKKTSVDFINGFIYACHRLNSGGRSVGILYNERAIAEAQLPSLLDFGLLKQKNGRITGWNAFVTNFPPYENPEHVGFIDYKTGNRFEFRSKSEFEQGVKYGIKKILGAKDEKIDETYKTLIGNDRNFTSAYLDVIEWKKEE